MSRILKIDSCKNCPNHSSSRHYTGDSWETVFKWECSELKKVIGYEEDGETPPIPHECPLESDVPLPEIKKIKPATVNVTIRYANQKANDFNAFCNLVGLNPYCMNEGLATGDEEYEISVQDARKLGLI